MDIRVNNIEQTIQPEAAHSVQDTGGDSSKNTSVDPKHMQLQFFMIINIHGDHTTEEGAGSRPCGSSPVSPQLGSKIS